MIKKIMSKNDVRIRPIISSNGYPIFILEQRVFFFFWSRMYGTWYETEERAIKAVKHLTGEQ